VAARQLLEHLLLAVVDAVGKFAKHFTVTFRWKKRAGPGERFACPYLSDEQTLETILP